MSAAPLARATDPITSDLAAEGANIIDSRSLVLAILTEHGPMADFQMVHIAGNAFSPQRLRTARHELEADGFVRQSSTPKALTLRGRRVTQHIVWEIAA